MMGFQDLWGHATTELVLMLAAPSPHQHQTIFKLECSFCQRTKLIIQMCQKKVIPQLVCELLENATMLKEKDVCFRCACWHFVSHPQKVSLSYNTIQYNTSIHLPIQNLRASGCNFQHRSGCEDIIFPEREACEITKIKFANSNSNPRHHSAIALACRTCGQDGGSEVRSVNTDFGQSPGALIKRN